MNELAAFCSECASLANFQLHNADSAARLRCLCAMFMGMKDNVLTVKRGLENNTCSVTNRMRTWIVETVREARALVKKLKEEPRQLNFFERNFLSFCVSTDNDELMERLEDRLLSALCRAFSIQSVIHSEDVRIVDMISEMSVQSARQEFLGCAFDLKKRIAASADRSERVYKEVVFQITKEYQKRQDERTAAGKRAYIRWHKAANDMIKAQLQQKLSEREKSIQAKDGELKKLTADMSSLTDENKKLKSKAEQDNHVSKQQTSDELAAMKKENEELKSQLESKLSVATSLESHKKRVEKLEQDIQEKESEKEKHKTALDEALKKVKELEKHFEESKASEKKSKEELLSVQQKLKETEAKVAEIKKQNSTLSEQVKAKQTENSNINQSVTRVVKENDSLKTQCKQQEIKMKTYEQELKSLREQLKERQEKEVTLLERNVELEESCKRVEEQMSLKEEEIMKLDSRCSELEDEMNRAIEEKKESIESLERKVRRLNTSLETAKKDLQAAKEELDNLQNPM